jgi:hypothetical protein
MRSSLVNVVLVNVNSAKRAPSPVWEVVNEGAALTEHLDLEFQGLAGTRWNAKAQRELLMFPRSSRIRGSEFRNQPVRTLGTFRRRRLRFKFGRPHQSFLKLTGTSQSPSPHNGKTPGTYCSIAVLSLFSTSYAIDR